MDAAILIEFEQLPEATRRERPADGAGYQGGWRLEMRRRSMPAVFGRLAARAGIAPRCVICSAAMLHQFSPNLSDCFTGRRCVFGDSLRRDIRPGNGAV